MRSRSALVPLGVLAALTLAACGGSSSAEQGGEASGDAEATTLTVYTSEPQAKIDEVVAAFQEVRPDVEVEVYRAGTGELKTRIATEKESGEIQADVLLAADVPTFEGYSEDGDLQVLDGVETDGVLPSVVDPEGFYVGTRVIPTVIAHNTEAVGTPPASWAELTDEQWQGRIAMPNPDVSGAAAFNLAVWELTEGLGQEWIGDLVANQPTVLESNGPVGQAVAAGTSDLGVVVDYVARELGQKGSPIAVQYPDDGVPYVSQPAGVFADSDNAEAANAFIDFLVSAEGQQVAVEQSYLPVREDVGVPEGAPEMSEIKLLEPDLTEVAENQDAAVTRFNDLLG
jgi:iron(III) transport system substrate-binding protein